MLNKNLTVAVIGAGPAGTSTVGCLLEKGFNNIYWIDPRFEGGELEMFESIQANARAMYFSTFANLLKVFSKHAGSPEETVDVFDHEKTRELCNLDEARLCLLRMTNIIRKYHSKEVTQVKDIVKEVIERIDCLQIKLGQSPSVTVKRLFVCIGAERKTMDILPQVPRLNLYDLMSPLAIERYDLTEDIVDVFGSKNSGLLVLHNLMKMKKPPRLVRHYLNQKLIYGEYITDTQIQNVYTGLLGIANEFGKQYEKGQFKDRIITYRYDPNNIPPGATKIVEAVGFNPKKIRFTDVNGQMGYDLKECQMHRKDGSRVQNIHFVGFVNPEIITSLEGERVAAVAVLAFMNYGMSIIKQLEQPSKL